MFFTDCNRRIDFVLVYQRRDESNANELKRNTFIKTLINEGLEIEVLLILTFVTFRINYLFLDSR